MIRRLITTLIFVTSLQAAATAEPLPAQVLRRIMRAADKDQNGCLTQAEYLPLDVQAKHHGDEHFKAGDANGDGQLDNAELAAVLRKQTWFAILSEGADACFIRLDENKDGKLDAIEYRKISRMGGHAEQHFKGADGDMDGFLNLSEFKAHAEKKLKGLEQGKVKK